MEECEVVWKRPSIPSCNDDVWDDTVLIEAYDRAVAQLKDGTESENKGKKQSRKKTGGPFKKVNGPCKKIWSVGVKCLALYSEDNLYYEATIVSLEDNEAQVKFDYYDNVEHLDTEFLLPLETQFVEESHYEREKPEANGWQPSAACYCRVRRGRSHRPAVIDHMVGDGKCQITFTDTGHKRLVKLSMLSKKKPPKRSRSASSNCSTSDPALFPPFMSHTEKSTEPGGRLPPFPSPPLVPADVIAGDEEALASMLMSWYMSGYHTGYYQGLQSRYSSDRHPSVSDRHPSASQSVAKNETKLP